MNVPTLQELQQLEENLDLTNLQWMALKSAAGYAVIAPRKGGKNLVWKQLQGMGLLNQKNELTLLGKMRLSEAIAKKKKL